MANTQSGATQAGWNPEKSFENMQAEIDRLNLQKSEWEKAANEERDRADHNFKNCKKLESKLEESNRLNGELRSLLEYTAKQISHREPPHGVDEMHLEVPLTFKDNCLRCRADKALGDVANKPKQEAPVPIRRGCICGSEGMCDYHRLTDVTTPIEKRVEPSPLEIATRCPKCKKPVDNVIHFCQPQ